MKTFNILLPVLVLFINNFLSDIIALVIRNVIKPQCVHVIEIIIPNFSAILSRTYSPQLYSNGPIMVAAEQFDMLDEENVDENENFAQHQVALTPDMINILLDILSPECKVGLENAMRTNGRYEITEKCKLELRQKLLDANMIPSHLRNGNVMGVGMSIGDGGEFTSSLNQREIDANRIGSKNRNKIKKSTHSSDMSILGYVDPILQFMFHPIVAIILFICLLIVVAVYAVLHVNGEMKRRGINLYSKPKKLSKKKEEKQRAKNQGISVIR